MRRIIYLLFAITTIALTAADQSRSSFVMNWNLDWRVDGGLGARFAG